MRASLTAVLATALFAAAAAAQPASYGTFGQGCPSPATRRTPALAVEGIPRLGKAFTVAVDDGGRAPGTFLDLLVTGASNNAFGPFVLPWNAPFLSPCPLRVSPDVLVPIAPGQPLSVSFLVPNDLNLLGLTFYQQWFVAWQPAGGGTGFAFGATEGGVGVLGL